MIYANITISSRIIKVLDPLFRSELEWYVKSISEQNEKYYDPNIENHEKYEILYGKDIVKKKEDNINTAKNTDLYEERKPFKFLNNTEFDSKFIINIINN